MTAKKYKVLLIDDSPTDRRIYRRFLEEKNSILIKVLEAATGKAGVAACQGHEPDCIVLDFKLPDTDGLRLINELRNFCRAPIVFVSGQPMPLTQTQAYNLGVVTYLSKDFVSSESLKAAVGEALKVAQ